MLKNKQTVLIAYQEKNSCRNSWWVWCFSLPGSPSVPRDIEVLVINIFADTVKKKFLFYLFFIVSQRLEGKYYTFERFKPHYYLSRLLFTVDNYWTAMAPRKEHVCVSGFIHRPWKIQCWCENKRYITLELAHKSMSITRRRKPKHSIYLLTDMKISDSYCLTRRELEND